MPCILVIDDEKAILEMLHRALSKFGLNSQTAISGEKGIEKFDQGDFDAVITDILMPGIDGIGVLRHIRSSSRPETPVIGISGTPWLLKNEDFDLILDKPFSLKDLIGAVKALCEKGSDVDAASVNRSC